MMAETNTHRFKNSVVSTIVGPGHKARPSHQACTHVADYVAVQIGHHHHIKLLRLGHQLKTHRRVDLTWVLFKAKRSVLFKLPHLHGGVVHNHAVKRDVWVA